MFDAFDAVFSSGWISSAFYTIAIASTLIIIAIILSENRNPVKSLAWVVVLLLLPVFGVILYLFFGRSIKNTRLISRRNRRRLRRRERAEAAEIRTLPVSAASQQLLGLGKSLTGAPAYAGNSVEVFTDGKSKFDALLADIRSATRSINLQYYIFEDDTLGRRVADALIERAAAGVKVRVMYDHVGSFGVSNRFFKRLRAAGIEAYPFFKVTFPQLATRINWRNHRKLVVIDGAVAYLGGMNIAERYLGGGKKFDRWRDTHVRVTGPIVSSIQYSFTVDWNFMGGELLPDTTASTFPAGRPGSVAGVAAQMLTSGPTGQWPNIAHLFHKAIVGARRRVYIQTPYFLPTEALLKALQAAALAHVDVRIMLPARSDSAMLTHASASYIGECMRAGIKFYLYQPGMLHSKMMIVDDEFVTIGSTNFDFRSFECNFESNLFFYSRELNERMLAVFRADQEESVRVNAAQWNKRPLPVKVAESVLRLLSPVL